MPESFPENQLPKKELPKSEFWENKNYLDCLIKMDLLTALKLVQKNYQIKTDLIINGGAFQINKLENYIQNTLFLAFDSEDLCFAYFYYNPNSKLKIYNIVETKNNSVIEKRNLLKHILEKGLMKL
jgi:hypothetical protein